MTRIEWREEYSVGVADVDFEHRELIDQINDLLGLLDRGAPPARVCDVLGEIHARIAAHFALEEKFMRDTQYPAYPAHKDDHEALLDEILDIMESVEVPGGYDESVLSSRLERWFSEHFRTHDALLHGHWTKP